MRTSIAASLNSGMGSLAVAGNPHQRKLKTCLRLHWWVGGAASLLAHYALAQATLGVAFMPDVGDSKAVAVKKKVSQPAGDLTSEI